MCRYRLSFCLSKKIFEWLRKIKGFDKIIKHFEAKAEKNRDKINRGKQWGLLLFVAIPLPGTGGWTGALMASLLEIPPKKAFPIIALGVLIAGLIMTTVTYGIGWIVSGS
ncbi:MAG: COG2426 family protein [Acutalibacteraceae bacterium]